MAKHAKDCEWCLGTGRQFLMRSWFIADGYYRSRCSVCAGTGKSAYPATPDWKRFLKTATDRVAEWGALKPSEDALT